VELDWTLRSDPYSRSFDDIYYAEEGGLEESRYVFLEQNSLSSQFETTTQFCIGELGFGTSLNFLATFDLWNRSKRQPNATLHYVSCEKFPLSHEQIRKALDRWPEIARLKETLLSKYSELARGFSRIRFEEERVVLTLLIGDSCETLRNFEGSMNAWFLDGFSPRKNPEMWSEGLMREVAAHSQPGATFATYTAAGHVRRSLEAAGFETQKFKGFGRKREMLKGRLRSTSTAKLEKPRHAIVIGGGVAGASVASALSKRNISVSLFEENQIASRASSNFSAITLPILSKVPTNLSRFCLEGFHYLKNLPEVTRTGIVQVCLDSLKEGRWLEAIRTHEIPASIARLIEADEASKIAGMPIHHRALYFPEGGIMNLPKFCRRELAQSNIQTFESTQVARVEFSVGSWTLFDRENKVLGESEILILAAAYQMASLFPQFSIPLRKVRGQAAFLRTNGLLQSLRSVLCFDGFLTPIVEGENHFLGATYDNNFYELEPRKEDNEKLLQNLVDAIPELSEFPLPIQSNWVELRTNVPGMEPVIGELDHDGPLYVATAFSSRASIYGPLAGEVLASKICNEPVPMEVDLYKNLTPRRFDA
jgi:tRNA 5-methylaminomethyl-2-thiouridine biosynthesis bifunctional protein